MFGTSCFQQLCVWRSWLYHSDTWLATNQVTCSRTLNSVGLTFLGEFQARTSVRIARWLKLQELNTATSATSVWIAMKVTASGLTIVLVELTATLTLCLSSTFGFALSCSVGPQWVLTLSNIARNRLERPVFTQVCAFIVTTWWFITWFVLSIWSCVSSTCSGLQFTSGINVPTTAIMRPHTRDLLRNSAKSWSKLRTTVLMIQIRKTLPTRSWSQSHFLAEGLRRAAGLIAARCVAIRRLSVRRDFFSSTRLN